MIVQEDAALEAGEEEYINVFGNQKLKVKLFLREFWIIYLDTSDSRRESLIPVLFPFGHGLDLLTRFQRLEEGKGKWELHSGEI